MKKNCLFWVGSFFLLDVYADDCFLLTIENRSGHTVRVDTRELGRYSSLGSRETEIDVEELENAKSLELSITSKAGAISSDVADKIRIFSSSEKYSELVVEPASLNSDLIHVGKNDLSIRQQLRDTGVGYKVIIPARSMHYRNSFSKAVYSWFQNMYSRWQYC